MNLGAAQKCASEWEYISDWSKCQARPVTTTAAMNALWMTHYIDILYSTTYYIVYRAS